MTRAAILATVFLAVLGMQAVRAEAPGIEGAWSWQSSGQGGMDRNNILFNGDGSYVRASQLATGQFLRSWGQYRAVPVSPGRFNLQSTTQGWLPQSTCVQVSGFPPRCNPVPHPPDMSFPVDLTSPSTMSAQGLILYRDSNPVLLQQQVPRQAMLTGPAPIQPHIQQPVMPTLHPYVTPNGPGNRSAMENHAGAKRFIDENMRECYRAPNGQLWGCKQ